MKAVRAPEEADRDLLRRRAAALARVPLESQRRDVYPAVLFRLGGEAWALAAEVVLQVMVLKDLTPLPGAAAPLYGVTEWRGDVLLLLDLREELGIPVRGLTDLGRVVIIEGRDYAFGILADSTAEMIDVEPAAIRRLPGTARRLVRGMLDTGTVVLDADALLQAYGSRSVKQATSGG